jgi:hypothetical protein
MVALEALGHVALTMKDLAIFKLMVIQKTLLDWGVCFLQRSYANQQWSMKLAVGQCFLHARFRNLTLFLSCKYWACSSAMALS